MITTREARLAAEAWLREEAGRHPELVGAILAGSTRTRDLEAPHPPSSDVDLFIYVDAEVPSEILEPHGRFAPRKLAYRGVVLEPSFHEARLIADAEAVLGDIHLAPLFTEPCILRDPYGKLAALAAAVKPGVLRRRHAQRRLAQALGPVMPRGARVSIPDIPALRAPCWRNIGHGFGVMRCALATLVADLRYPTVRRSFVVAREVLCAAGREDLADELLRLLGSFALSRAEVEELAAEAERTYDVAVEVRRTPVVMDWNVSREVRELERAAVRELIEAGHHREALLHLLVVRTAVQGIIENDGGEEARASSRLGYQRLLAALGIDGDEPFLARGQALRAFLPTLSEVSEALLARAPGLVD
jgi:phage tail protein X